jgi:hypothetical protein
MCEHQARFIMGRIELSDNGVLRLKERRLGSVLGGGKQAVWLSLEICGTTKACQKSPRLWLPEDCEPPELSAFLSWVG